MFVFILFNFFFLLFLLSPIYQKPSQSADLHKLYTMGDEPDRKMFLDRLLYFLEEKGSPITSMPQISKQPLDLYKLYHSVKEKGGMVEVSNVFINL